MAAPMGRRPPIDEMTQILTAYQRHQGEAASLVRAALVRSGDLDEDGEPYPGDDPIRPADYQAAAAVHAQLALAAATAPGALTTLRASRAGQAS